MNYDDLKTEYEIGTVTDEQLDAVDRLLASIADREDSEVDYASMLRNIKAEAMERGLASKLAYGKDKKAAASKRRRRLIGIAASVAAVFAVGIGTLSVLRSFNAKSMPNQDVSDHMAWLGDTTPTDIPLATDGAVSAGESAATKDPSYGFTDEPAFNTPESTDFPFAVNTTPLPTEFAVKGGMRGYTYLGCFDTPETVSAIVPSAVSGVMAVEPYEDGFGYTAKGDIDNGLCSIDCRIERAGESDIAEGAAIYTLHDDGRIGFVWRINTDSIMYVEFSGFEYSVAEELLLTFVIEADSSGASVR